MLAHFLANPCTGEIFRWKLLWSRGRALQWLPAAPSLDQTTAGNALSLPQGQGFVWACFSFLQTHQPALTISGHSGPLLWCRAGMFCVGLWGEKHCSQARRGSQWQGGASRGTTVIGRSYLLDNCVKICPAMGGTGEKLPKRRGWLTAQCGGDMVAPSIRHLCTEKQEKYNPWRCFPAAGLRTRTVGFQRS